MTAREEQADAVRTIVKNLAPGTRVTFLTRPLIVTSGKVLNSRPDSFDLRSGKRILLVKYINVLEIKGGGWAYSSIPADHAKPFGLWDDIDLIYPGTKILVLLENGRAHIGFANSATAEHLVMLEREKKERFDIRREDIKAVYGLIGGYGGVKAGGSKGAEAMHAGRDKLLGGVMAGVGALMGLAKSEGRPVLVFSK